MRGRREPGMRVCAIRNSSSTHVYLFGCGTYDGDFVPPTFFGKPMKDLQKDFEAMFPGEPFKPRMNPRITLDSGEVVWGQECWWGPEDELPERVAGRVLHIVPPPGHEGPTNPRSSGRGAEDDMASLGELRRAARDGAQKRGHRLQWGSPYHGESRSLQSATCANGECGAWVQVNSKPEPNGIDIGGSAMALDCPVPEEA